MASIDSSSDAPDSASQAGAYAFGPPSLNGVLRQSPTDFRVDELLGFEPSDEGPHALLRVEKTGINTLDLIAMVARSANIGTRDIGYCGLKDRHAVTSQWLSLPRKRAEDAAQWSGEGWRVVETRFNQRKLKLGAHRCNKFVIRITDLDGDMSDLTSRIERIAVDGVPNYFGAQRFGHDGDNLRRARRMFVDGVELNRRQRRFAMSAARSWVFNRVLSRRVAAQTWTSPMPGEPLSLDGSRSFFMPKVEDREDIAGRLVLLDLHPSGPLWGAGDMPCLGECEAFEREAVAPLDWVTQGLADAGMRQERRALRLKVEDLDAQVDDNAVTLRFTLTKGAFATAVIHALARVDGGRIFA